MPGNGRSRVGAPPAGSMPARWLLVPSAALAATGLAVLLIRVGRAWLPYLVGGTLVFAWLVWVLVSSLTPGRTDRRCPRCGRSALVPLRRGIPLGVRCAECGYRDETAHVPNLSEA